MNASSTSPAATQLSPRASRLDPAHRTRSRPQSLWHGLLFLHGHITHAELAQSLAMGAAPAHPDRHGDRSLLQRLMFLGGRPMHAGENFDVEEPLTAPGIAAPGSGALDPGAAQCTSPQPC